MTDTNAPERISMRVASWSTNEPQPDGWCLNLADQAVTCKVGGLVFSYGIEEGLRQYTSAIRADLATPAPREDGYSAGVRAAAELAAQYDTGDGAQGAILALLDAPQELPGTNADPVVLAPALPDARAGGLLLALRVIFGMSGKGCEAPNAAYRWCERIDEVFFDLSAAEQYTDWAQDLPPAFMAAITPACTATDGPASACVYRAPGLATNEYGDDIPGRIPDYD